MHYEGKERRIHRVVVTKNTEYHLRRRRCVRVRDRNTGRWLDSHVAKNKHLVGAIAFKNKEAKVNFGPAPEPGESVYFILPWGHLITSPVLELFRPPRDLVYGSYPEDDGNDEMPDDVVGSGEPSVQGLPTITEESPCAKNEL
jgi:hypothetical protein